MSGRGPGRAVAACNDSRSLAIRQLVPESTQRRDRRRDRRIHLGRGEKRGQHRPVDQVAGEVVVAHGVTDRGEPGGGVGKADRAARGAEVAQRDDAARGQAGV